MDWIELKNEELLDTIKSESVTRPVVLFKHSSRCSTSSMVLGRLERAWNKQEMNDVKFYFLNLISYRAVSQKVAELFGVEHESPQVLVIYKGACVYSNSHYGINYQDIKSQLAVV